MGVNYTITKFSFLFSSRRDLKSLFLWFYLVVVLKMKGFLLS